MSFVEWVLRDALRPLHRKLDKMSAELDRLTTEVAETKGRVQSAIVLIRGLAQQVRDNATDPAALNALADDLDAQQAELGAAIDENPTP